MIEKIGNIYAYIFSRPSFAFINKCFFYLGARGLGLKNFRTDTLSGEDYVVKKFISKSGYPVIFDVGSNIGSWSQKIMEINSNINLHIFEPQKNLTHRLAVKFPHARVNSTATGDVESILELYDYEVHDGTEHATLLPNVIEKIHAEKSKKYDVNIIRLDNYCKDKNITHIDFIKIDVEGYELKTLLGCGSLIKNGSIKYIQFEFNEMNILSRAFLSDFFILLKPNYDLYRILRSGLLPLKEDQRWINEQFTFQNILAIRLGN